MSYNPNTYANIRQFGQKLNPPCVGTNHPLTMCLATTMDRRFQNGSAPGQNSGPRSMQCQTYMAQRCADKWDGFCEYFYKEHGSEGQWPDNQKWPIYNARQWEVDAGLAQSLTTGEQLLRNTAERKYCTYTNCTPVCEPFDPTNPNSPTITYYVGPDGSQASCKPICNVNPSLIDNDPVMDRMLANPEVAAGTLINICNTAHNTRTNLNGTKLGKVCDNYLRIKNGRK